MGGPGPENRIPESGGFERIWGKEEMGRKNFPGGVRAARGNPWTHDPSTRLLPQHGAPRGQWRGQQAACQLGLRP